MATHPFQILDVFTDRDLAGNQLAVFTDGAKIPEELLQPLALEMGFAETVAVFPPKGDATARIRIFTPVQEIPFAGHPTLGTAIALALEKKLDQVVLTTGQGNVPLSISNRTERGAFGTMQQPIPRFVEFDLCDRLLKALGVESSIVPIDLYDNGMNHIYVIAEDVDEVVALRPNFAALEALAIDLDTLSPGFNCAAGRGLSWTTRMFAPGKGISEDAATGSAAGPLAVHLARHGLIPYGQTITISQGAQIGRPSTLFATAFGNRDEVTQVEVAGNAVVVASGQFSL